MVLRRTQVHENGGFNYMRPAAALKTGRVYK